MNEGQTVGAREAEAHLSEILDRVEHGEEFVITRDGKPIARLTRASGAPAHDRRGGLQRLRELREHLRQEGTTFPTEEILSYRNEGRR